MRYITRLRLENFQDHKDTTIELTAGINLITGSSDAGKSAILRALNLLLHNQPRGDSYVRLGSNETRVTAWWNDGTVVTRVRGKGSKHNRNAYDVQLPNGSMEPYDKIGTDIPPDVLRAMGMPPTDEKHGPLSYAAQMDPLFLVSLSSADLPRSISELCGIDDFEGAAKALGSTVHSVGRQIKESEIRLTKYNSDLEVYDSLEEQIDFLHKLEDYSNKIDANELFITNANHLLDKFQSVYAEGTLASKALDKALSITKYRQDLTDIQAVDSELYLLKDLIQKHTDTLRAENEIEQYVALAKQVGSEAMFNKLELVKRTQEDYLSAQRLLEECLSVDDACETLTLKNSITHNNIEELQSKHAELKEMLIKKGMLCDKCGQSIIGGDTNV